MSPSSLVHLLSWHVLQVSLPKCSQADLRKEQRSLERTIRDIQRSERDAKKMVQDTAKRGDMTSAKVCMHKQSQLQCCEIPHVGHIDAY